jgi:hypothetical protein
MLRGDLGEGDTVRLRYDAESKVRFEKTPRLNDGKKNRPPRQASTDAAPKRP